MKVALSTSLLIVTGFASAAQAVSMYHVTTLGFQNLEHTASDGSQSIGSFPSLNDAGQVIGRSTRYNGGAFSLGQSAWLYDSATTSNIGFTGPEYATPNGSKNSFPSRLDEAGRVVGTSDLYIGNALAGQSVWQHSGGTTTNIGLIDAEHTGSDMRRNSRPGLTNEAGQATGSSVRFDGLTSIGTSTWFYDGTTTHNIGMTGPEHTGAGSIRHSPGGRGLNESGKVVGLSTRYNGGNADLGQSIWLYDGATTRDIGLTGAEFTRYDGYKFSDGYSALSEAGQFAGWSTRFFGGALDLGQTAWLYDGVTTIEIGLTGPDHTGADGQKFSIPLVSRAPNLAGQIAGYSRIYNGGEFETGGSAWLYNGATTIDIGLTDTEHTADDLRRSSFPTNMNEAGQVLGHSNRFNGDLDAGVSRWLYDGSTTINIGLTDAEHTRSDGYRWSDGGPLLNGAQLLNEAGQVIGNSQRFNGGSHYLGGSAWLYDGATTINVGLTGPEHTADDGFRLSRENGLNEAGQVVGTAERYLGGSSGSGDGAFGQDAWFYDPVLQQTFALNLSTRSDGYAFSEIRSLSEDGLVLGSYTLFDAMDNEVGTRAFKFSVADGLHDLGALVDGGLAANGLDYLTYTFDTNSRGQILSWGKKTSQPGEQVLFLLTPVPEPSAVAMSFLFAAMLPFGGFRMRATTNGWCDSLIPRTNRPGLPTLSS